MPSDLLILNSKYEFVKANPSVQTNFIHAQIIRYLNDQKIESCYEDIEIHFIAKYITGVCFRKGALSRSPLIC